MASQQSTPAGSVRYAQLVGNAFVQQFFLVLHKSPDQLHRFYKESSKLGRPGPNGEMTATSSLQDINEKILSMDYSEYRTQIKTVDAQETLNGGVLVLVTGYLFGKDDVRRGFTQSFLLATQETGFYVLNDIFRFVEEEDQQQERQGLANETWVPFSAENGTVTPQEHYPSEQSEEEPEKDEITEEEVYDPSEHGGESSNDTAEHVEKEINEVPTALQPTVAGSNPSTGRKPNVSYASIVMAMKEKPAPVSVAKSAPNEAVPTDTEQKAPAAPTPAPALARAAKVPARGSYAAETNVAQESEAEGYSIYIKRLPLNATCAQLEEVFKIFGPIKPNGIQVRRNMLHGFCFGFVEFEVADAVKSAIKASPVLIGGRKAYVEEKRTNAPRVNNQARFAPVRGAGYRGNGMRGRGYYGGGRGYGRWGGDYSFRPDFGNRGGRGGGPFWPRRRYRTPQA
ncbi:putative G3BP-like protein [Dendrobium catenatum]|uniref:Nuclear transport factor 2 n=1 Tax=Dendrobium catenatum TaxID=906689 RepID=A0A2I0WPH6_9ASPA|nr:putative G3BP-like protein [Dendrobium catenatum]PKU77565.1 Nuclear transport factor 2 [Dendrobium catenatum]